MPNSSLILAAVKWIRHVAANGFIPMSIPAPTSYASTSKHMAYKRREGLESERLQLIWDIYNWAGSAASGHLYAKNGHCGNDVCNKNREQPIAWCFSHIFAAIAGGYVIELSAHYKGVQLIRKNKDLWDRVKPYVKTKTGEGCLPYDEGGLGEKWEHINGVNFFDHG